MRREHPLKKNKAHPIGISQYALCDAVLHVHDVGGMSRKRRFNIATTKPDNQENNQMYFLALKASPRINLWKGIQRKQIHSLIKDTN